MSMQPTSQTLQMRCRACRGLFEGDMLTNVSIEVAVASMKALYCPHCGSKKLSIGQSRTASEDAKFQTVGLDAAIQARADAWLVNGEKGLSADAIRRVMTASGAKKDFSHPRDGGDLHRCMLLLRRIPEWEARIGEMAECSPEWRALVAAWPDLAAAFHEEAGPDMAVWPRPKTGAILETALQGAAA